MKYFIETTHLSEIIENSNKEPVIIFKFSSECGTSSRLKEQFEKDIEEEKIKKPIYLVTVQIQKSLSKKIEEYFGIKHESPQVIVLNNSKVEHTANHFKIKTEDLYDKI